MKLELMKVIVKSVSWGDRTEILKDGTLKVNKNFLNMFQTKRTSKA